MDSRHPESVDRAEPAVRWLQLVERVAVCSRLLRAGLDQRMAACQLNPSQFSILWACHHAESGSGQSQLAELLAVSPAHISGLVEQLRRRKLLAGHRPSTDRRRQLWRLTPQGRQAVESVLESLRVWAEQVHLPPEAAHSLARLADEAALAVQIAEESTATTSRKGAA